MHGIELSDTHNLYGLVVARVIKDYPDWHVVSVGAYSIEIDLYAVAIIEQGVQVQELLYRTYAHTDALFPIKPFYRIATPTEEQKAEN